MFDQGILAERIRTRAYYLSLERGANPGSALEDWLRAESEVVLAVAD